MSGVFYMSVRGLRNHNPLNIKWDGVTQWNGQTGTDGTFVVFKSPEWGIRAGGKILNSYARRGVTDIEQIISTWAPPSENDTESYINSVVQQMGRTLPNISRYSVPDLITGGRLELVKAMIKHENGEQPFSDTLIQKGLDLA